MAKLTPKQQRFADEWLIDMNGTQAAIRAGYSPRSANEQAARLLAKPSIRAYIDERLAEQSRRTGVTQERIIRELARIAFCDPTEIIDTNTGEIRPETSPDDRSAIAAVKVRKIPTPDGYGIEREIRVADKIKALELLGKRFGMFRDKVEMTGEGGGPITVVFSDKMRSQSDAR